MERRGERDYPLAIAKQGKTMQGMMVNRGAYQSDRGHPHVLSFSSPHLVGRLCVVQRKGHGIADVLPLESEAAQHVLELVALRVSERVLLRGDRGGERKEKGEGSMKAGREEYRKPERLCSVSSNSSRCASEIVCS